MNEVVNLNSTFARIADQWNPRVAGQVNNMYVKLVKFGGEFLFHHHEHEDELFFVHRGAFTMRFRDRDVIVSEGEFLIVPRGVEHCPVADKECEVLLFEPATTLNTGNVHNERTRAELSSI